MSFSYNNINKVTRIETGYIVFLGAGEMTARVSLTHRYNGIFNNKSLEL